MTLNDRYALISKTMRVLEPTTKIWMKIDPHYQRQKCRPMSLVSGDIRFMRIFAEFPWGGGVKRQWGCRERPFSAFSLAIFRILWRWGQRYYMIYTQYVVCFSVIPKCMTLNDLEWLFRVKFCFAPAWLAQTVRLSKNNCVKTNKDRHILSAAQIFGRESTSWQYKVCADIRSGSLEIRC